MPEELNLIREDDGPIRAAGDRFVADATHIDLIVGSHVTTLQTLCPGPYTLAAVWADADDIITTPLLRQTSHITVAGLRSWLLS